MHAGKSKGKAFDGMNSIAANMLLNLTSSMRFEGPLNVDLNDITMNLVPFPRLHFLLASMSPLAAPKDVAKLAGAPRAVDQVSHACQTPLPNQDNYILCNLQIRFGRSMSCLHVGLCDLWTPACEISPISFRTCQLRKLGNLKDCPEVFRYSR